ncbi:MAG: ParB/RepB/Spo0J family partition protein [Oscillatoria princeps RMCB-10]|jgi:ParB family chromosome partitioning protein|nr:ParB/RepB/Spo0J family partition protein [Oscillatoria princeps RMCB-10]
MNIPVVQIAKQPMNTKKTQPSKSSAASIQLPLEQISPSKLQPRSYFSPERMAELTESVKQHGVIQPILVRPFGKDHYELVAGERRYQAARAAGLTQVPAVVRDMNDAEALRYALMENLQREDLNPVEETEGILKLLELSLQTGRSEVISLLNQMSKADRGLADNVIRQEDRQAILSVFQSLGRLSPESFRTNRLPILNLPPDVRDAIRQGQINYTKGREIGKIKDADLRAEILKEASAESLSLREIRERINEQQQGTDRDALPTRMEAVTKKIKQLKVWDDPDKREKVEALLAEMEMLLSEE